MIHGAGDPPDQRASERTPLTLVVEYDGADDLLNDYTENLSLGGTFVATSREVPIGTVIQLVLRFPGLVQPIRIDGVVRWNRGWAEGHGVGIEFLDGPHRDRLAEVIRRVGARDPKVVARVARVLVVDDNQHVATLIRDGLGAWQRREQNSGVAFEVHAVTGGVEAIDLLERVRFDAMIIEVHLAVIGGPKLIRAARHDLGLAEMAIIAVSSGDATARRAALEAGADIFLAKPMRLRQILETIHRLLPSATA